MRIGIVAGETSGDKLGAGLVKQIQQRHPDAIFQGIGGPGMQALGVEIIYPMDRISIMGLDGLFDSFIDILKIRRNLIHRFMQHPPDVFVGVDVPDFNLALERKVRQAGVPVVHYVSPTVWAWRGYRIRKIRQAVDLMLTLFPFEQEYFAERNVKARFVGHPIANEIARNLDATAARRRLEYTQDDKVIALLPGSRLREVNMLAPIFFSTASLMLQQRPELKFVVPAASADVNTRLHQLLPERLANRINIVSQGGQGARDVLQAASIALVASGTAALEAALVETPMIVAYKVSVQTFLMVKCLGHVKDYAMPNHLLKDHHVPEFIQSNATPGKLFHAMLQLLDDEVYRKSIKQEFKQIRNRLQLDADVLSAEAVLEVAMGKT